VQVVTVSLTAGNSAGVCSVPAAVSAEVPALHQPSWATATLLLQNDGCMHCQCRMHMKMLTVNAARATNCQELL